MNNTTISFKVSQEIKEKFYTQVTESGMLVKEYFAHLVNNAENPVNTDNTERITVLETEINRLENLLSQAGDQLNELEAQKENIQAQADKPQTPAKLPQHHYPVFIHPGTKHIADQVAVVVQQNSGKKADYGSVMVSLFEKYMDQGPGDHLPLVVNRAQLRKVYQMYKLETPSTDD